MPSDNNINELLSSLQHRLHADKLALELDKKELRELSSRTVLRTRPFTSNDGVCSSRDHSSSISSPSFSELPYSRSPRLTSPHVNTHPTSSSSSEKSLLDTLGENHQRIREKYLAQSRAHYSHGRSESAPARVSDFLEPEYPNPILTRTSERDLSPTGVPIKDPWGKDYEGITQRYGYGRSQFPQQPQLQEHSTRVSNPEISPHSTELLKADLGNMVGKGKYSLRNAQTSTTNAQQGANQSWWPQAEPSYEPRNNGYRNEATYAQHTRNAAASAAPGAYPISQHQYYQQRPSTPPIQYQPLPINLLPSVTSHGFARASSAPSSNVNLGNQVAELGNLLSKLQRHVSLLDEDDDLTNLQLGLARPITGAVTGPGYVNNPTDYRPRPSEAAVPTWTGRSNYQQDAPYGNNPAPLTRTSTEVPNLRPRKAALEANAVWGFNGAPSNDKTRRGAEDEKLQRQEAYRRALQVQVEEQAERKRREADDLKRARMIDDSRDEIQPHNTGAAPFTPAPQPFSNFPLSRSAKPARETNANWAQDDWNDFRPQTGAQEMLDSRPIIRSLSPPIQSHYCQERSSLPLATSTQAGTCSMERELEWEQESKQQQLTLPWNVPRNDYLRNLSEMRQALNRAQNIYDDLTRNVPS